MKMIFIACLCSEADMTSLFESHYEGPTPKSRDSMLSH